MMIAYDARPLDPRTRYWGVGVVIDNLIRSLEKKFSFCGLSHDFSGAYEEGITTWPVIPHLNNLIFEGSTRFMKGFEVYWGTNHFLPALSRTPSLVTVHDLLLLKYPNDQPFSRFLAWRLASSIKRADRIITDSQTTADDLIALFPAVSKKLEVGLLGFHAPDDCADVVEHDEFDQHKRPYVLMLGAHRPRKNLYLAVDACSKLQERSDMPRLLITGEVHPSFSWSLASAREFATPLGFVSKSRLSQLLKQAVALVFPSLYEGFGFPILEAMAAGCPVLALDTPINREICGTAAWLLRPDPVAWSGALEGLCTTKQLRSELIQKGYENLRRFSWQNTADVYADAFSRLS